MCLCAGAAAVARPKGPSFARPATLTGEEQPRAKPRNSPLFRKGLWRRPSGGLRRPATGQGVPAPQRMAARPPRRGLHRWPPDGPSVRHRSQHAIHNPKLGPVRIADLSAGHGPESEQGRRWGLDAPCSRGLAAIRIPGLPAEPSPNPDEIDQGQEAGGSTTPPACPLRRLPWPLPGANSAPAQTTAAGRVHSSRPGPSALTLQLWRGIPRRSYVRTNPRLLRYRWDLSWDRANVLRRNLHGGASRRTSG